MRIEKLKEAYDVDVQTVHFPLHADTPMEGLSLEELFAGRDMDMDAMYTRMKGMMDEEGLPYAKRTHTYNSRLAQELGKWADTQPGGDAIHMKLYQAYFVDQKNIADIDLLVSIPRLVRNFKAVLARKTGTPYPGVDIGDDAFSIRHERHLSYFSLADPLHE